LKIKFSDKSQPLHYPGYVALSFDISEWLFAQTYGANIIVGYVAWGQHFFKAFFVML